MHPEHLHGLEKQDPDQRVVNAFVTRTRQCASGSDILSLRLQLTQPPRVVGPVGTTTLSPKTETSAEMLGALRSLSQATFVVLHVANATTQSAAFDVMYERASRGLLRPSTKEYAMDALYRGVGGKDVGCLLAGFVSATQISSESPLSYDELALSPPPPQAGNSSAGKRPSASRGTTPPPKRKPSQLRFIGATRPLQQRLSDIEAQLAAFRATVSIDTKPAPTLDTDRLDRLEDEVRSLRIEIQRIVDLLQQNLEVEDRVMEKTEELVNEKLDDIRDTDDVIDDKIDSRLWDLKAEFTEWVKGAVSDAVSEQLPDALEAAHFSIHVPR